MKICFLIKTKHDQHLGRQQYKPLFKVKWLRSFQGTYCWFFCLSCIVPDLPRSVIIWCRGSRSRSSPFSHQAKKYLSFKNKLKGEKIHYHYTHKTWIILKIEDSNPFVSWYFPKLGTSFVTISSLQKDPGSRSDLFILNLRILIRY